MKTQVATQEVPMTARERLRELDRAGEFAPSWRPNAGDEVTGEILRYSSTELPLSGPCQIATIGQENGEPLGVFILGAVLAGEFEKKNPKVGETITVRYVGKHEKGYKKFVLYVHRDEEEVTSFHQAIGLKDVLTAAAPTGDDDPGDPFHGDPGADDTPYATRTMKGR